MKDNRIMIGNSNQLFKVRRIAFRDGMSEGIRAIEIQNQSGLYLTCIEDQCLNIYDFSYRGINCSFQSKNGLVSNRFFNGGANEFSYYWPAGMVYTCGLTNVGPGVEEDSLYYAEHGRIGMMPAENINIIKHEDSVTITGSVHDSFLCGHCLELQRTITIPTVGKEINIHDVIINQEALPTEMMFMYHCNFGYPLLAAGAYCVKSSGEIIDNIGRATDPGNYTEVTLPDDHKIEEVYCHTNCSDKDGYGYAAIINDSLALGCYLKYQVATLPFLIQWKNMCSHDYCIGLEPSNSQIKGRTEERKNGTLPVINPYETKVFDLSIGILDGKQEIDNFVNKVKSL